jgi:hypothetical protein
VKRDSGWALFAATVVVLLLSILFGTLFSIATGQNATHASLNVLQVASRDHGETLKKLDAVLNLKGSSVKAIVNGQNTIVGYLVINNDYAKAECAATPGCKAPSVGIGQP